MVVNNRSKQSRARGLHTHGWGSKKKRRGSGNKGGKGMAGSGKRSDAKKPSIWKNRKYFGKRGFTVHSKPETLSINAGSLSEQITRLAEQGIAIHKSGAYDINLTALGYSKLLGAGKVYAKINVTVAKASPKAISVIEAAGGSVTLTAEAEDEFADAEEVASEENSEENETA